MKLTNATMANRIESLSRLLDRTDIIGYAAARNTRKLSDSCAEFLQTRDRLINELGERETDDDGNPTGKISISINSPAFDEFVDKIGDIANIEHEVELMQLPYSEAIGKLSGSELLQVEWMFSDEVAQ